MVDLDARQRTVKADDTVFVSDEGEDEDGASCRVLCSWRGRWMDGVALCLEVPDLPAGTGLRIQRRS